VTARATPVRAGFRALLALLYAAAGFLHLRSPAGFIAITPDWVPDPARVVMLTGLAEIAGAAGLMLPRRLIGWARPAAGFGLALYALCVWPANLHHALADIPLGGVRLGWWYHGPRLALQPLLIWWALWAGECTDWPFGRRARRAGT